MTKNMRYDLDWMTVVFWGNSLVNCCWVSHTILKSSSMSCKSICWKEKSYGTNFANSHLINSFATAMYAGFPAPELKVGRKSPKPPPPWALFCGANKRRLAILSIKGSEIQYFSKSITFFLFRFMELPQPSLSSSTSLWFAGNPPLPRTYKVGLLRIKIYR